MSSNNRIYVGNLPFSLSEEEIREKFAQFGAVDEVALITDKHSGKPKGFGFITYSSAEDAEKAISEMDGKDFAGRNLKVNIARPKEAGGLGNRRGPRNRRFSGSKPQRQYEEY